MSKNKNKHRQQAAPVKNPHLLPASGATTPAPVGVALPLHPGEVATPIQAAQAIASIHSQVLEAATESDIEVAMIATPSNGDGIDLEKAVRELSEAFAMCKARSERMVRLEAGEASLQESQATLLQQQSRLAADQRDIDEREAGLKKREEEFRSLEDSLRGRELNAEAGFVAERRASLQMLDQEAAAVREELSRARGLMAAERAEWDSRWHEQDIKVRFDDVAGIEEAKSELIEVVSFLQTPERYQRLGAQIPKGVLLVGPPGTGKTLLARAIAGEAGVPFFSISGSEFVEMFVGVGAARVRDLFEQAKTKAPCIIFIDELDAVGKSRSAGPGGMGRHDEQEQTLNQLLVEMDGFDASKGVVLLAATNRPEVLDSALLRAGRFDRRIVVELPDVRGRVKILDVHMKKIRHVPGLDVHNIAARTPGFSGADLANLVNEAALLAARHEHDQVDASDFEEAADRLTAGIERRSRVLSVDEKNIVAHHEAGHALVAALVPNADPVHKITIIPRSMGSLGFTMQLPLEDKSLQSKPELEDRLAVLLGGRAAEELIFGQITTGAHNDIERATQIARHMVYELGMSERLGPVSYLAPGGTRYLMTGDAFGGRGIPVSEATAQLLDSEVTAFVHRAHERAGAILSTHRPGLERLAVRLRERETLDGEQLKEALADAKVTTTPSTARAAS